MKCFPNRLPCHNGSLFLVVVLLLAWQIGSVQASHHCRDCDWSVCSLEGEEVVALRKDALTGQYVQVIDNYTMTTSNDTIYARKCPCSVYMEFYCEVQWNDCRAPPAYGGGGGGGRGGPKYLRNLKRGGGGGGGGGGGPPPRPNCFSSNPKQNVAITLWLPSLIMTMIATIVLVCTRTGGNVKDFGCNLLSCGRWNKYVVQRIRHGNPVRGRIMIETYTASYQRRLALSREPTFQRAMNNPVTTTTPQQLHLKTTLYHVKEEPSESKIANEDEPEMCSICCADLEEGDRIGLLPSCQHKFHVECLKEWLPRKNTCPYCQAPAAVTNPQQNTAANSNSTTIPLPAQNNASIPE